MSAHRKIYPPDGESEYSGGGSGIRVEEWRSGDELQVDVDLIYPSYDLGKCRVRIGLEAVRAVDDIIVRFNFESNEWEVLMRPEAGPDDVANDEWRVVAKVPAWLEREP